MIDKKLLKKIKKYVEECEVSFMNEYSSNIVNNKKLFNDKKRMPKFYYKIKELINA